jgi:hypothetical protein
MAAASVKQSRPARTQEWQNPRAMRESWTLPAWTIVLATSLAFGCGKSSSSTETAARGSQDESQRLSAQCAQILAKSFGVSSSGNSVKIAGHTISTTAAVEQGEKRDDKFAIGVRISIEVDGRAVPALTSGGVGIDSSREAALTTALDEWSAGYGTPIVEAIARRQPALSAGGFDVYAGPTGIRGTKPDHLGDIHAPLFAIVTPELSQLATPSTMHAMTLMLVRDRSGAVDGEFRVDGAVSERLKQLALKVTWPEASDSYMLKQFYVLIPSK